ncbi:MAG: YCF48-related protein [Actinomycetota bacterium]
MKYIFLSIAILLFILNANAQWQKQNVDTKASLRGLVVVNEKVIWASGTGGTVLRAVDGGKTWSVIKVAGAEKLDFRDVEAFDENTAYILSIGTGESSRIYKTTDGGKTWNLQFKNTNPKAFFDALAFWDKTHAMAMSDPVDGKYPLLETSDGEIWNLLDNTLVADYKGVMAIAKNGEAAFAASGTCLLTQGKNNIFLVSGGADARVFRSSNRGLSWTAAETPIIKGTAGSGIFSIAMRDSKNGVIVGGNYEKPNEINNNLAFTNDGGKTWNLSKGLNGYRSGVAYIDKKTIIAVGASGSDISTDGGKTWKNLDKENFNSVQAKGKRAVWAVGANGLVSKFTLNK